MYTNVVKKTRQPYTKTNKKSRKTFIVDQTVYFKDEEHNSVSTPRINACDDKKSQVLHIPIPMTELSESLQNQLETDLMGITQKQPSIPIPFDPGNHCAASIEEEQMTENQDNSPPPMSHASSPSINKMAATTLFQFFGIVKIDELNGESHQAIPKIEIPDLKLSEDLLSPVGCEKPFEKFDVVWKKSKLLGTTSQLKNNICNSVCHWCCHTFENLPIGAPMKFSKGKFYIRGNYCSYACTASAVLYDRSEWNYQPMESYSLLHLMYRKIHNTSMSSDFFIRSAPSRDILKLFGGPCTIEEFRQTTSNNEKRIECFNPPFISLVSTIEEITLEKSVKKRVPFNSRFQSGETGVLGNTGSVTPIWLGQGLAGSASHHH